MDGEGVVRGRTEGLVEPNFSWGYPSGVRAATARRSSPNHGPRRLVGAHGLRVRAAAYPPLVENE